MTSSAAASTKPTAGRLGRAVPQGPPGRVVRQVDIAKAAGVSRGAVSAVLSSDDGKPRNRIHPDTAAHIRKVAQELGYKTDVMANALRGGKTRTIATLWPPQDNNVTTRLLMRLQKLDYGVYHAQPLPGIESLLWTLDDMLRRRVDLLLIQVAHTDLDHPRVIEYLQAFPAVVGVVMDSQMASRFPGDVLIHDHSPAIEQAVAHLHATGRRRPALLHTQHINNIYKERAFLEQARSLGLAEARVINAIHRWEVDDKPQGYINLLRQAFEDTYFPPGQPVEIDALLTGSDVVAMVALRFFESRGLRTPQDVAVVGIGDSDLASLWQPALASINRNLSDFGTHLSQLVMSRLEQPDRPRQVVRVPMTFVHRASAG